MLTRTGRALLGAAILVGFMWLATPQRTAAECAFMDRWPSFTEAAPTAERILVGEVVESYFDSSAGSVQFRVRVTEVLRGNESRTFIDFRGAKSGMPLKWCPGDSILRARVGDVIAFALNARVSASPKPIMAVAWIRGKPIRDLMPGVEILSYAAVKALAALPAAPETDTLPVLSPSPEELAVWPVLAGLLGALALLVRVQRTPT